MPKQIEHVLEEIAAAPELKAYVYQQVAELKPYLGKEALVTLSMKNHVKKNQPKNQSENQVQEGAIRLVLAVDFGAWQVEAEGCGDDMFAAILNAKQTLLVLLQDVVHGLSDPQERALKVDLAAKGRLYLH